MGKPRQIRLLLTILLLCLHPQAQAEDRAVPESRAQLQLSFAPVVKSAAPAVVNIYTRRKITTRSSISPFMNDPFFSQFFGNRFGFGSVPRERVISSLGSGVIVSADGMLVTSYHVIKGSEEITVHLADKREFEAKVERVDEKSDLALLKIQAKGAALPFLAIRDSDTLEVGDLVLAIGNPFGVGQTVTSGIISALARPAQGVSDFQFFIQTDAAINPGNSGGALVDMGGTLIGINSAIYSRSGGSNGIGFAIPSNMAQAVLGGKGKNGRVVRPWLGVLVQPVTEDIADSLRMKKLQGVLVREVYPASPATKSGLGMGDVILSIDGNAIDNTQAFDYRIATAQIGEKTPFEILRGGGRKTLYVTLQPPPETPARDVRVLKGQHPLNGYTVANLSPALAAELNLPLSREGVVVLESASGGSLSGFGMRAGDIILEVNKEHIRSTKQLENEMDSGAHSWTIAFRRGNQVMSMAVRQ